MAAPQAPESPPIVAAPPPWTLKGDIYTLPFWSTASAASSLSTNLHFLYAPLEAASPFSKGKFVGGLGMLQLIRYTDSPVGPYDELTIVPGKFEYEIEIKGKDGKLKKETKNGLRCSRIYVSQEKTCWNGRKNWNIPKHLADFKFIDLLDGQIEISVHPRLCDSSGSERLQSTTPFFQAKYRSIPYIPSFPASTAPAKYLGVDLGLFQPPLPEGKGEFDELVGTDTWCKITALEWSKNTSLGWWDMKMDLAEERPLLDGALESSDDDIHGKRFENFWPGFGRWRLGAKMADSVLEFGDGEHWRSPK